MADLKIPARRLDMDEISAAIGGGNDIWGSQLQGDIVCYSEFICAPYICAYNQKITGFSAPNCKEVSSLYNGFISANALNNISFPNLETVLAYGFASGFAYTQLVSVEFPKLKLISTYAFSGTFNGVSTLNSLYFPALQTVFTSSFIRMLQNTTQTITVHFPVSMQSVLENDSDVLAGFGNSNAIILFDLPAVE